MTDPIILPPLPMLDLSRDNLYGYTADQLRARDMEIARLVLEAAADFMKMEGFGGYAIAIRALEVKHE